jgi:magnesium transporter
MIRALLFQNGKCDKDFDLESIPTALAEPDNLLWVDFQGNPPEVDEPILRDKFKFHPLAIDDALRETHVPRVDDWEDFLYIVLHSVTYEPDSEEHRVQTRELDVFLGKNFMVTHHDLPIDAIERVLGAVDRDKRQLANGPDHLLYRLVDEVVASYMPVIEAIDEEIDEAEDQVFTRPTNQTLETIFRLKRSVLHLRRILGPQREALNKLARDDYPVIDEGDRVYFRDVYDHLVRMHDITESLRDLVSGTLDSYLSVINNRMNEVMKTLTIITTLFMPISFLTGFFGMNFFQPVEPSLASWTNSLAFGVAMVLMLSVPIGMFAWMIRRGWMNR